MVTSGGRMKLADLIEQLDQRYGNPYSKEHELVKEAIRQLKLVEQLEKTIDTAKFIQANK